MPGKLYAVNAFDCFIQIIQYMIGDYPNIILFIALLHILLRLAEFYQTKKIFHAWHHIYRRHCKYQPIIR